MDNETLIRTLSVLGQESRLGIYQWLCERGAEGACPSDIAEKLSIAPATLSFHLKTLTQAGLLDAEADGRFIRYRANHGPTRGLVRYLAKYLCGLNSTTKPIATPKPKPAEDSQAPEAAKAKREEAAQVPAKAAAVTLNTPAAAIAIVPNAARPIQQPVKETPEAIPAAAVLRRIRPVQILFLGQANAARSILGEALTNHFSQGRCRAFSAGNRAVGRVNRYALRQLELAGIDGTELNSKSWDQFCGAGAPEFDLLIGMWDAASAPSYPQFNGRCQRLYWPTRDPSLVTASVADAESAFGRCYDSLRERVDSLLKQLTKQLEPAATAG